MTSQFFGDGPLTWQDFRRISHRYSSLSLYTRMQVWARLICLQPILKAIEQHVPLTSEQIVDLGSGHGLVSLLVASRRNGTILGIEASPSRLAMAQEAVHGFQNIAFQHSDIVQAPLPPCDVILLIDVLYLFSDAIQSRILTNCVEALLPNGILLIKENTTVPRWKYQYADFEERIKLWLDAYGVRTRKRPNYRTPESWRYLIRQANLQIQEENFIRSIAPYPGVIYVCRK